MLFRSAIGTEKFDLVLAGLQSDDLGVGQTGVILAEMLGIPHATIIMEIKPEGTGLRVKRELEGGWFEWVAVPLPALLTIQSGLNKPRYASLLGIKKAKTKPLRQCTLAELLGGPAPAPAIRVRKVYAPVRKKATEFLSGSPKEIATALVGKLRQELSAGS